MNLSGEQVWNEFKFQARIKYLAFKRAVWLGETLILFILALSLRLLRVPDPWRMILLAVQAFRVIGELLNHYHLATLFNVRDRWTWFPFIS